MMIDWILRRLFRFCHRTLRSRGYDFPGWTDRQNQLAYDIHQAIYQLESVSEARKFYNELLFSVYGEQSSYDRTELSHLNDAICQLGRHQEARKPRIISDTVD